MRTEPSEKEEEGSGRRAGSWVMTNNCKCVEHWTHPAVLPSHSWPGPDPHLSWVWMLMVLPLLNSSPGLSGEAVGGRGEDPGEACSWPAAWPGMHPSPPRGQIDSPQTCPSCACSHPPWEGKGALGKSLAEHLDSPDCPSSRVPHPLCLHRACCRRLTAPWHRLPSPCMCFPTGLTV